MNGTERINGVDLFVRRFGDPSRPALVVVHGGPGWDHSYLLAAAELQDIAYVVFLDLRGCGRSTREAELQPDLLADDLAALIGPGGTADVLGFSYGGGVAMRLADQHPARVRRLILASTTAYPEMTAEIPPDRAGPAIDWADPAWSAADGALARALAEAELAVTIWRLDRADEWRSVLAGVRFSSAWDRPFLEGRLRPARPADPARAIAGHPVLILHGEHDLAFPVAAARRLAGEVATARLVVVPEAGHMAQFDNPGAWLGAIREFLTA